MPLLSNRIFARYESFVRVFSMIEWIIQHEWYNRNTRYGMVPSSFLSLSLFPSLLFKILFRKHSYDNQNSYLDTIRNVLVLSSLASSKFRVKILERRRTCIHGMALKTEKRGDNDLVRETKSLKIHEGWWIFANLPGNRTFLTSFSDEWIRWRFLFCNFSLCPTRPLGEYHACYQPFLSMIEALLQTKQHDAGDAFLPSLCISSSTTHRHQIKVQNMKDQSRNSL